MLNENLSSSSSSQSKFNSNAINPIILKSNAIRNEGIELINGSIKLNHSSQTTNALAYDELIKYKNCGLLTIQLECMNEFKNLLLSNDVKPSKLIKSSSLNGNTSIDKWLPSNKITCKNSNKFNDLNVKELFDQQNNTKQTISYQPSSSSVPSSSINVGRNNNNNNNNNTEDDQRRIITNRKPMFDNVPAINYRETPKNPFINTMKYNENNQNNYSKKFENNYNSTKRSESNSNPSVNVMINDFMSGTDALRQQIALNPNTNINYEYKRHLSSQSSSSFNDRKDGVKCKFIPPIKQPKLDEDFNGNDNNNQYTSKSSTVADKRLKNIEPKIIELIENEIIDSSSTTDWNDIAGLDNVKSIIQEMVIWPMLRPDIFTGLRRPPRGILLFGPPGTGKTLIGKCIASQSKSTFFSISASSLTSKWMGEGEKMVRALFAIASVHQPSVIFIDEIDSLLCQRTENDHESSRRIKTEFLVQLDGAATNENDRLLIIGATNRPQELDEAARRRLVKRLYIPLPKLSARIQIVVNLLASEKSELSPTELEEIGKLTDGFSGADMKTLCHEASMEVIRGIPMNQMETINPNDVRTINFNDFKIALSRVRASVSQNDLNQYIRWDKQYGSGLICSSSSSASDGADNS